MTLKAKAAFLLVSLALFPGIGVKAMTVEDFGRMNEDDESTYVALLIEDAAHILKAHGQPDQAAQTIAYFKETGKFGGVQELVAEVKSIDALNKKNAINPNNRAPVYQIEDAMESVLKDKGIKVSAKDLLQSDKDFHPVGPPRQHILGN
jgi:hypothetical protein